MTEGSSVKTIPLTQGQVALVDDADYEWLNKWRWKVMRGYHTFYAMRGVCVAKHKWTSEQMHRLILGLQPGDGRQCDHRDGDGLNNQRANLRVCTRTQNGCSSRKRKFGTSRHKGVSWHRRDHKWQSYVRVNKIQIHLGYYQTADEAARAYDAAAKEHYGEFALTNAMLGLL